MVDRKPYLVVILIQLIYTGMYVVSKAALNGGLNSCVFVFYRQAAATILLVPLAIIFERKKAPRVTVIIFVKLFIHAFLGITLSLNVYNVGLRYTSATAASATTNSVPVITFFLAVLFRMETIKLPCLSGFAKILGILFCFVGIMIIAFYRGPRMNPLNHHHLFYRGPRMNPLNHHHLFNHSHLKKSTNMETSWLKGTFLMITANTGWSLWLVLQSFILKDYPSKLFFTTLQCLFSTIQSFFVAWIFERAFSKWKLGLDTGLLAIAYCGIIVTGVSFYLQTWCIEKKGPVFVAISTPLALVFTIICSSILLGEQISLGSVIGGALMVCGLYSVLWGKSKETVVGTSSTETAKECLEGRSCNNL